MTDEIFETPSSSPNFQTELAEKLAELVPEAVADGKIDVLKLQELLAQDAAEASERFGLFWPGKQRALRVAQIPTTATLRPVPEKSKEWDTTKNVFIEGDNLEVLKILQKHYHSKIKMIYIDPPYNTGKDFVYPDNFKEGLANYLEWTNQVNENGMKISSNSETDGRYHSNWLNMMYPRLKLARNLLSSDGLIFISIDDNEATALRKLCDEIFGESNFVGQFIWRKGGTGKNDSQFAVVEHEYILCFARNYSESFFKFDPKGTVTTSYSLEDDLGKYSLVRLDMQNLGYQQSLDFPITGPDGTEYRVEHKNPNSPQARWRWSNTTVADRYSELVFKEGRVYTKNYSKDGAKVRSLWTDERFGVTRTGKADAEKALGVSGVFDFPKPVSLIEHIISISTGEDDLVLDFFAGSGTTAEAVMKANQGDGGKRNFILVQLPEPTPEESIARAEGFATIAEISLARVKGAMLDQNPEASETLVSLSPQDKGVRVFSLTASNFEAWNVSSSVEATALEQHLFDLRDSALNEAQEQDLLTEILIKQGYSLTESIQRVTAGGLELLSVGGGLLLAYLDENVKPRLDAMLEVVAREPSKLIILEDSFQGDDELKTNLTQLCKSKNIELWTA